MYLEIKWKKIWPYEWIIKSDNSVEWNVLPILYDNAKIELFKDSSLRYSLWYKISKNLLWKEIKYADIINENTWETFSFQVSNIFLATIFENDLKVLALVWEELKLYENFWKSEKLIENDWDKKELTPLWYFDMFVSCDDEFYYPLILNEKISKDYQVRKFYDYYWYKSYEDEYWNEHLIMLIEADTSTENKEVWYFVDNFNIISENITFNWDDSEYVEVWDINSDWDIFLTSTSWKKWYLDKSTKKILEWELKTSSQNFTFTRAFEDTDGDFIVWKNDKWFFIIDRTLQKITSKKEEELKFFKDFITHTNFKWYSFFLMLDFSLEIVLVNENWVIVSVTDLDISDKILKLTFLDENIFEVELEWQIKRKYLI